MLLTGSLWCYFKNPLTSVMNLVISVFPSRYDKANVNEKIKEIMLKESKEANHLKKSRNFQYKKVETVNDLWVHWTHDWKCHMKHFVTLKKKFLRTNSHWRKLLSKMCGDFFAGQWDIVIRNLGSWSHLWKEVNKQRSLCRCFLHKSWKATT